MSSKNFFTKAKERVTLFEIGFFLIFGTVGVVLGEFWPENASKIIDKSYIATVFGLIFGALGFICSLFFRAIHETIPSMHKHIKKDYEKLEACIEKKEALINIKINRPAVFSLLSEFAEDSVSHLIGTGENIFVSEYVRFLESSLIKCSKKFYATSLLTPKTWLNTPLYMEYFGMQAKKKQEITNIEMCRVFLCQENEFNNDLHKDALIKKHKDNGIKIGYYNPKNFLSLYKPEYRKDFVMFVNDEGTWILDAGQISEKATIKDKCKIRFVFRPEDINSEFSDIFRRLENVTWL